MVVPKEVDIFIPAKEALSKGKKHVRIFVEGTRLGDRTKLESGEIELVELENKKLRQAKKTLELLTRLSEMRMVLWAAIEDDTNPTFLRFREKIKPKIALYTTKKFSSITLTDELKFLAIRLDQALSETPIYRKKSTVKALLREFEKKGWEYTDGEFGRVKTLTEEHLRGLDLELECNIILKNLRFLAESKINFEELIRKDASIIDNKYIQVMLGINEPFTYYKTMKAFNENVDLLHQLHIVYKIEGEEGEFGFTHPLEEDSEKTTRLIELLMNAGVNVTSFVAPSKQN